MEELGYDGYQRLRRAFDRSFGGENNVPSFKLVIDAGCGTGLVGEQVRVFYSMKLEICIKCISFLLGTFFCSCFIILNTIYLYIKFRNVSQYLVGADLSPSIIDEAIKTRPNLYNETKVGDVTNVFIEMKPIDLIIAADSYIYFGDLNPLFESMSEGLVDNGFAAFTLENPSEEYEER